MHDTVLNYGKDVIARYGLADLNTIIEVGSQDVNGSLRQFFDEDNCSYTGYDILEGKGVDRVIENVEDILEDFETRSMYDGEYGYNSVDLIICTEMFEHDKTFWITLDVFATLLKKGGYLLLSARGVNTQTNEAMFEHSFPHDYWRFMPQSVPWLFDMADCEPLEIVQDTQHPGFMSIGRKI